MARVAVVTGGNQGLGYALVADLCRALPAGSTIYLTARSRASGEEACRSLNSLGLSPVFQQVDVTVPESIEQLTELLRDRHGGVDVIISNAAARIVPSIDPQNQVRTLVETNNLGTTRMIQSLWPLLRNGSRFLVVASSFGSLRQLSPALHPRFETATLDDIDQVMLDYAAAVEQDIATEAGWPPWINIPSKIGQVAAMRIFARILREDAQRRDILVNAVCPGLVDTPASRPWFSDMSRAQSPARAAADIVWLATLPAGATAPYGELVQHRKVIPWR